MRDFKRLSIETWPDFERLFLQDSGVHASCYCMYHKMTMAEYIQSNRDERRARQLELVRHNQADGLLMYEANEPIAWCQFDRAERFFAFDRMRDYLKLAIPIELRPAWRITCLFVAKRHRGEGLSAEILGEAVSRLTQSGPCVIEAFVADTPEGNKIKYTGSVRMFERLGFQNIAPIGKHLRLMRRTTTIE